MTDRNRLYEGCSYGELYIRALNRRPDAIAFVWDENRLTYRALAERISQTVQVFEESGLRRGDAVAHLSQNSPEAIITWVSCSILGMSYIPLHPMGTVEADSQILTETKAKAVVVDEGKFAERAESFGSNSQLSVLFRLNDGHSTTDYNRLRDRKSAKPLVAKADVRDVIAIFFTGGTTGKPKGVMHSSRSLVANALICSSDWEWPADIRMLLSTPISHAAGYIVLPTLLRGGTIYLQNGFNPVEVIDAIERHRITATFWVPTMIYMMLDQDETRIGNLSSLEMVLYGAAPMSPVKMKTALEIFGPVFVQGFGQTEAPNAVCMLGKASHRSELLTSCGMPMTGMEVKILSNRLEEVPVGELGEICIAGPLVMEGYLNNEIETEQVFSGGWLHTGDLGKKDAAGNVYIIDRLKDMVISGGFNIYPKEIEDVLAEHPAVKTSAVIGAPDEKWGEVAVAYVVRQNAAAIEESELVGWVKKRKGPVYSPKSVRFVDSIPLTPLGKPDKKSLRENHKT
jgi:fatty-acyl-CoA synthase